MPLRFVDPVKDLGSLLSSVEKPARYTGGEYGRLACVPKDESALYMAAAFPDLYEIGMSNQALRILYNRLNRIPGIACDRAFAPAPDFENLLRERGLPLYGLDTGVSLKDIDILCFTLSYELGISGVLTMLASASIPLRAADRSAADPVVIMGGPCVSNPFPYGRFIDAFWIGEAEGGFFELAEKMRDAKKAGEGRAARRLNLLSLLRAHPSVWMNGKDKAARAVDVLFARRGPDAAVFPVPSMKIVQHHGAVEIMRGCPSGCRFCHAGVWYRPMRQKDAAVIAEEARAFIEKGGYREISLSSLSTGDYNHIDGLLETLTREYSPRRVSFQLPSLKVSSFSLPILEKVSRVRKSGLTFAVETANEAGQLSINKGVSRDSVVSIINEARKNGWRGAKFYFMIGLPLTLSSKEEEEIVDFIVDVARRARAHFNINVGVFVPKPHTPYQRSAQIDEEEARKKLNHIRAALKPLGHKVSAANPFTAMIEGVLSRGDERVGGLVEEAFLGGCRLDAWDEFFKEDVWRGVFSRHEALVSGILSGGGSAADDPDGALPWDCVSSGVSEEYLRREYENSACSKATASCAEKCPHPCGVCPGLGRVVKNSNAGGVFPDQSLGAENGNPGGVCPGRENIPAKNEADPETRRIIFSFMKDGSAVWLPHLSLIEVFSMTFLRAGIPVLFTRGFNPLIKLDFASPLSVGIKAEGEIASVDIEYDDGGGIDAWEFVHRVNRKLPSGIAVVKAMKVSIASGAKKHSAASLLWGYEYRPAATDAACDLVEAAHEKAYRQSRLDAGEPLSGLCRRAVLSKRPSAPTPRPESYFTVYSELYR
jgi:radical SAM-linked protein